MQTGFHMTHATGPTDALLWVPHVVCGAVTKIELVTAPIGDGTYLKLIATRLTTRVVDAGR